jgi:transposase
VSVVRICDAAEFSEPTAIPRVQAVVEVEHDYHVYVKPAAQVKVCRHCGSVKVSKWGGSEIVVRDIPAHGKRVSIYIRAQRLRRGDCDRSAFEPLPALADGRRMTRRLVAWIGAQSLRRVFAAIADETGVDEKTVRNIFHDYIRELDASNSTRRLRSRRRGGSALTRSTSYAARGAS